jgi:hypothetical protein
MTPEDDVTLPESTGGLMRLHTLVAIVTVLQQAMTFQEFGACIQSDLHALESMGDITLDESSGSTFQS